ncbi:MAG: ribonuclease HIII [Ignavibacteria bacterium]|nr:MAG: ribonuclease HIII [Ignavibacteria bacterium]KAF0161285.1 MAG: ribonuclease HIII [Ignavibacteria bacterium]
MLKEKAISKINELKKNIDNSGLTSTSIIQKNYHYEFDAIQDGKKIKILLYFGKKGLNLVIQGDQKSTLYSTVNNLVNEEPVLGLTEAKVEEPNSYIGTDEAGKGDIFGPLVIAAVFVDKDSKKELLRIGVRDSKALSDPQIDFLAAKIKNICKGYYSIIELRPELYNRKYEEYKNLNKLLSFGHSKAIKILLDDIDAKTVISDKFSTQGLEIHRDKSFSHVEFIDTEKAERFIAVAAASILARNTFNKWFYELEYKGLDFPKGSSEKAKSFLKRFLKQNEYSTLINFAKLHFKTIKESLK